MNTNKHMLTVHKLVNLYEIRFIVGDGRINNALFYFALKTKQYVEIHNMKNTPFLKKMSVFSSLTILYIRIQTHTLHGVCLVITERTYFIRFFAGTRLFHSQFATVPSSTPRSFASFSLLKPYSYLYRLIFPPNVSVSWSNG